MTQRRQTTTIRDIAEKANVSYQTVSLVINNKRGVSEATRKRILSLMEDMGYHPNRVAQMLTTNRSHTLEAIVVGVRGVPIIGAGATGKYLHKAHTALDKAASDQTVARVDAGDFIVDAILFFGGVGLLAQIDGFGHGGLHAKSQFI